jgi:hypothetical protein
MVVDFEGLGHDAGALLTVGVPCNRSHIMPIGVF